MVVYILFESARFNKEVKYVSKSKRNVTCAMKKAYGLGAEDCARAFQYGLTIGNPNLKSDEVFITISVQEVETNKLLTI